MNPLIKKLNEYGSINQDIEKELMANIKRLSKKKGDHFLKQGQVTSSLFVIEKGLVRSYYIQENREINSWFGFENTILGSVIPLFYNLPANENIQFLEPTIVHYILKKDLDNLYQKHSELNTIGRKMIEDYCVILEGRVNSLQTQTAEQRYNSLLKTHPDAVKRISLGHIASYLGITPETLSRIRNK